MPSSVHIPGRPALLKIKGTAVDLGEGGGQGLKGVEEGKLWLGCKMIDLKKLEIATKASMDFSKL